MHPNAMSDTALATEMARCEAESDRLNGKLNADWGAELRHHDATARYHACRTERERRAAMADRVPVMGAWE